ncbi:hypothetical protein CRG98_035705, partial [Punica granatum]
APPEKREIIFNELRRVGAEGAKVLRELGSKVKRMEKLGPVDILDEVHEAAEELQNKIDRKSYILVNSESWEIGNRPKDQEGQHQDLINFDDDEKRVLEYKSCSEAILDLRFIPPNGNWDSAKPSPVATPLPPELSSDGFFRKQISWPTGVSFVDGNVVESSKTYESASALSLATFASLLIEFVARLQNLVDEFEELSLKAKFKEPNNEQTAEHIGILNRLRKIINF